MENLEYIILLFKIYLATIIGSNLQILIIFSPAMYYDYPEITPHNRKGDFKFNKLNEKVTKFASIEVEARALVEGQFMAKRLHVEKIGYTIGNY